QPVQVFEEDYTLAWVLGILGALLVMAIIGFFVGRWWRRRPKKAAPPPPPRPPWEVALEQLEAIRKEQTALIAGGRQVELVDRISDVVREYLGHRYDFNGLESTSDEVVARLRKVKLRRIALTDIQNLLADSDLVKFAKAMPDTEQCTRMREAAVAIVKGTTPSGGGKLLTAAPEATKGEAPKAVSATRIVLKTGEVTLPLSVRTPDEARQAIGAAVGSTVRDMRDRQDFDGTIRVVLGPELPVGEATDAVLREIHDELASELDGVSTGTGRRFTLILEHFHGRLTDAAEGESVAVMVVDDDGSRIEHREPKGRRPAPKPTRAAPEPRRVDAAAPTVEATVSTVEPTVTPTIPADATVPDLAAKTRERPLADETRVDVKPAVAPDVGAPETPAVAPSEEERSAEVEIPPSPGALRVTGQAFPEALDRVVPVFFTNEPGLGQPLLRWVTGVPQPVAYRLEGAEGPVLFATAALRGLRASRAELHDRALANLRRVVPPGFAPTDEPAWLDGGAAAVLLLPDLVPHGEAWIAYPDADGALVVMKEGASTTDEELARLAAARGDEPLFDRPVRVTRHGFAPAEWPAGVGDRRTDPGHSDPRGEA
ncbi:MAG: hypothetical protein KC619_32345, partial [Myxococcales bacterium]|nr:hypothetical protein [Myxococcales bacterium]